MIEMKECIDVSNYIIDKTVEKFPSTKVEVLSYQCHFADSGVRFEPNGKTKTESALYSNHVRKREIDITKLRDLPDSKVLTQYGNAGYVAKHTTKKANTIKVKSAQGEQLGSTYSDKIQAVRGSTTGTSIDIYHKQ